MVLAVLTCQLFSNALLSRRNGDGLPRHNGDVSNRGQANGDTSSPETQPKSRMAPVKPPPPVFNSFSNSRVVLDNRNQGWGDHQPAAVSLGTWDGSFGNWSTQAPLSTTHPRPPTGGRQHQGGGEVPTERWSEVDLRATHAEELRGSNDNTYENLDELQQEDEHHYENVVQPDMQNQQLQPPEGGDNENHDEQPQDHQQNVQENAPPLDVQNQQEQPQEEGGDNENHDEQPQDHQQNVQENAPPLDVQNQQEQPPQEEVGGNENHDEQPQDHQQNVQENAPQQDVQNQQEQPQEEGGDNEQPSSEDEDDLFTADDSLHDSGDDNDETLVVQSKLVEVITVEPGQ
jgi:hypothetical protein